MDVNFSERHKTLAKYFKYCIWHTVKPILSGHSKLDKTKKVMTNGSLMKVKSIAECSNNRS